MLKTVKLEIHTETHVGSFFRYEGALNSHCYISLDSGGVEVKCVFVWFFLLPGRVHHCHVPIHHAPCSAHPWRDPAWSCRRHQVLSLSWYLTVSWPTGIEPGVGSGTVSYTEGNDGGWWWWCNGNRFFFFSTVLRGLNIAWTLMLGYIFQSSAWEGHCYMC